MERRMLTERCLASVDVATFPTFPPTHSHKQRDPKFLRNQRFAKKHQKHGGKAVAEK
jgi:hypothetical protein